MRTPSLTEKVDINLGYGCNLRCPFCYYYDSIVSGENLNTLSTEQAKSQLQIARRLGIKEIEFTGGEVTLRKDLPELIRYYLNEEKYAKKLAISGLDDVLFSLHGHNAEIHDELTATRRSFQRIIKAIYHANEENLRIRTNSVICRTNYKTVSELLQLCIDRRVDNINLIMFNPIIQANQPAISRSLYVRHRDAGLEMIKAFDMLGASLPHTNVRYMPFCALPGYEHMITNHDQFNFEADEWNNFVRDCIKDGVVRATKRAVFALPEVRYKRFALRYGIKGLLMAGMGRHYVKNQKVMSPKCLECAFVKVCDYVWKGYYEVFGDDVSPVAGDKIDNPVLITSAAKIRAPGRLPAKMQPVCGNHVLRESEAEARAAK